jgi:hypothetical protein
MRAGRASAVEPTEIDRGDAAAERRAAVLFRIPLEPRILFRETGLVGGLSAVAPGIEGLGAGSARRADAHLVRQDRFRPSSAGP